MIRAFSAADAPTFVVRRGRLGGPELAAETWPRTPPEGRELGIIDLFRSSLPMARRARPVGVSVSAQGINGLIVGRSRAGGLVWDVEHVQAPDVDTGVDLLRWVREQALAAHVRRLFIETASSGIGLEMAQRAGFERYSGGKMLRLEPGFIKEPDDTLPARPRLRVDEPGLFQLYNAAVPANVRVAEAMTQEEWAALYRGPKLWTPKLISDLQDYVWELGSQVAGWMRVIFGQRCQFLELMVHPTYESYADRMALSSLTQMSAKAAVVADVREYQGAVEAALGRAGFRPIANYVVWVLQLSERVPAPARSPVAAPVRPSA